MSENEGKTSSGLSEKQKRFAQEYLIDLNATQAAIRAGYAKGSADVTGTRLLANASVKQAITTAIKKREERTEITQDRVLKEVARLAFLDVRKAFNPDGSLKPLDEIDDDTAAALAGLEMMEEYEGVGKDRRFIGYTKKVRLSDKTNALTLLMRHLGMLNDKMKLQGDPENPVQVTSKVVVVPQKEVAQVSSKPLQREDGSA